MQQNNMNNDNPDNDLDFLQEVLTDDGNGTGDEAIDSTDDGTDSGSDVEAIVAEDNNELHNNHARFRNPNAQDEDFFRIIAVGHQFLQLAVQYIAARPRNYPFIPHVRFDLRLYDDDTCTRFFRFQQDEIRTILASLRMPDIFKADNGLAFASIEGLSLVLRRLAYPCRLIDLVHMFGRSESSLSRMISTVLRWIHRRWSRRLLHWDHQRLTPAKLEQFAAVVSEQGSPLPAVIGFIDGTVRPIARPTQDQELDYNGHHRVHALKYQAVTTPDGIIVHLAGPYQGRHHDVTLYRASGLEQALYRWAKDSNGNQMYIYGDPAYTISPVLQVPYPKVGITPRQEAFNESMSRVRVAVEWSFGHTLQYFAFSDFKKSQRSLLSSVHLHYIVSVIFANIHSCIIGTNASVGRFQVEPPTLAEYLHG